MNETLASCLDDLESRLDEGTESALLEAWQAFAAGSFDGDLFSPRRDHACPPGVAWPSVGVNAALEDFDQMALQQFAGCSAQLAAGSGLLLNVRCNYGSSIVPLLFGVEPFVMADAMNTLPTSRPLHDSAAIARLVEAGVPDLDTGYGARVFEMGRRFVDILAAYPRLGRHVHLYHPDTQGPMDVCEVVWGSEVFYALYDEPDLVKAFLDLICETYTAFLGRWQQLVPWEQPGNSHWGYYHGGRVMIRDDSAMNLSPAQFDEFIAPYDQRLLDAFGGGAIHFCGRGDHYIDRLPAMRGVHAVNLSQPEYNDMERIYAHTVDRGINLLGLNRATAEQALAAGRSLAGRVHC
ncbi:MAG: hypothetical protein HZB16_22270 [Armatimonadetes bacterium]|nr:hypothetical protein [Armatimonadota bacterium]